jgi:hypothetical protein
MCGVHTELCAKCPLLLSFFNQNLNVVTYLSTVIRVLHNDAGNH